MSEFREPAVGISKVYTRQGDKGTTRLVGGDEVNKDDPRLEAYGTVDELNAAVGLCVHACERSAGRLAAPLRRVQHLLFNLGSVLATPPEKLGPQQPRVTDKDVEWLETLMDVANQDLEPLRSFVLPGGGTAAAQLHVARTVCRRAERRAVAARAGDIEVRFLNRLSDAFFVWSRQAALLAGHEEQLWDPNQDG